ncbi:MEDS domain-containing protein [Streptomyces sp. NPDC006530]|uniref:MEDS domain-containing protein n=1 Tax=Streptomyces sp. NPDC006530 TaxID=3364750 RepID=UPI0036738CBB
MPTSRGPAPVAEGEHSFFAYDDDTEWADVVLRSVHAGLGSGRRVLCDVDAKPAGAVLDVLRRGGIDVAAAQEGGRLRVAGSDGFFRRNLPFDPDRVIPLVRAACTEALADGFAGLTVLEDKSWCARELPGAERLLEYELRLDREVYADLPVTGLCMFDRRVVPARLAGLLSGAHHSAAPATARLAPPPFTVSALPDGVGVQLSGSADLDSRPDLGAALAAITGIPGQTVRLDLSHATFIDAQAVAALVEATHHLRRQGRRLMLQNPPYSLRRVAQLFPDECGALEVPV